MIGYLIAALGGAGLVISVIALPELKDSFKKRQAQKKYDRLLQGVPSRTVFCQTMEDLYEYNEYPMYLNGNTYRTDRWHWERDCGNVAIYDTDGKNQGYLHAIGLRRVIVDGHPQVIYGVFLAERQSEMGKRVYPVPVIDVY